LCIYSKFFEGGKKKGLLSAPAPRRERRSYARSFTSFSSKKERKERSYPFFSRAPEPEEKGRGVLSVVRDPLSERKEKEKWSQRHLWRPKRKKKKKKKKIKKEKKEKNLSPKKRENPKEKVIKYSPLPVAVLLTK